MILTASPPSLPAGSRPSRRTSRSSSASRRAMSSPVASRSAIRPSTLRMNATGDRPLGRQRALRQGRVAHVAHAHPQVRSPGAPARSPWCRGQGASGRTPMSADVEDEVRVGALRELGDERGLRLRSSPRRSRAARTRSCRPTRSSTSTTCAAVPVHVERHQQHLAGLVLVDGDRLRRAGVRIGHALGLGDLRASASGPSAR